MFEVHQEAITKKLEEQNAINFMKYNTSKLELNLLSVRKTPFCKNSFSIESSQLICNANQLTGFYKYELLRKGVSN